ncbi:MAG TPA: LacI family DNA-binding transcriptional regulator [Microvirga sp.]|nr:LacI family DNA-binding transcriptional regulator [Microvirga sp.]
MERKSIGIRELARHLDVSIGTVSRALNGRVDVNPETRKRVQEAAIQLGYVPNQSGRTLRQGTTNAVALVMRTNIDRTDFGETFFMALSEGMQEVLAGHNLDLVILPCSSAQDQDEYLRRAVERHLADGFIISDTQRVDRRIDYLIKRRIPFVALGRSLSGGSHSWIDLDFEGMAEQSVTRLAHLGHRRIALGIAAREVNNRYIVEEAYRNALLACGLPFDQSLVVRVPNTEAGGYELGRTLLMMQERPTAVVLAQETLALGLYRSLGEAALVPGCDLAVMGFRQDPSCRFLSPPLTCFSLSLKELGTRLGEVLVRTMDRASAKAEREPVRQLWPMTLVEGESDKPASSSSPRRRRRALS